MIKRDKIQTSLQNCVDDSLYSLKNAKQSNKTLYYFNTETSLMQAIIFLSSFYFYYIADTQTGTLARELSNHNVF